MAEPAPKPSVSDTSKPSSLSLSLSLFLAHELPPPLRKSVSRASSGQSSWQPGQGVGSTEVKQSSGWTRQGVDRTSGRQAGANRAGDGTDR